MVHKVINGRFVHMFSLWNTHCPVVPLSSAIIGIFKQIKTKETSEEKKDPKLQKEERKIKVQETTDESVKEKKWTVNNNKEMYIIAELVLFKMTGFIIGNQS